MSRSRRTWPELDHSPTGRSDQKAGRIAAHISLLDRRSLQHGSGQGEDRLGGVDDAVATLGLGGVEGEVRVCVTTGTPDEGLLLTSYEPRRDRTPDGWRFVRELARHASSRQFESQPTEARGRYEPQLNAHRSIHQADMARPRCESSWVQWRPGEVVVHQEVWKDRVWSARPFTVVEDDGERLLLWMPRGTRRKVPMTPPSRPDPATLDDRIIELLARRDWVYQSCSMKRRSSSAGVRTWICTTSARSRSPEQIASA